MARFNGIFAATLFLGSVFAEAPAKYVTNGFFPNTSLPKSGAHSHSKVSISSQNFLEGSGASSLSLKVPVSEPNSILISGTLSSLPFQDYSSNSPDATKSLSSGELSSFTKSKESQKITDFPSTHSSQKPTSGKAWNSDGQQSAQSSAYTVLASVNTKPPQTTVSIATKKPEYSSAVQSRTLVIPRISTKSRAKKLSSSRTDGESKYNPSDLSHILGSGSTLSTVTTANSTGTPMSEGYSSSIQEGEKKSSISTQTFIKSELSKNIFTSRQPSLAVSSSSLSAKNPISSSRPSRYTTAPSRAVISVSSNSARSLKVHSPSGVAISRSSIVSETIIGQSIGLSVASPNSSIYFDPHASTADFSSIHSKLLTQTHMKSGSSEPVAPTVSLQSIQSLTESGTLSGTITSSLLTSSTGANITSTTPITSPDHTISSPSSGTSISGTLSPGINSSNKTNFISPGASSKTIPTSLATSDVQATHTPESFSSEFSKSGFSAVNNSIPALSTRGEYATSSSFAYTASFSLNPSLTLLSSSDELTLSYSSTRAFNEGTISTPPMTTSTTSEISFSAPFSNLNSSNHREPYLSSSQEITLLSEVASKSRAPIFSDSTLSSFEATSTYAGQHSLSPYHSTGTLRQNFSYFSSSGGTYSSRARGDTSASQLISEQPPSLTLAANVTNPASNSYAAEISTPTVFSKSQSKTVDMVGSSESEGNVVTTKHKTHFASPTFTTQGSLTYTVTGANSTLTLATRIPYGSVSAGVGQSAKISSPGSGAVTLYTTFLPSQTTFTHGSSTITISSATTLILTTSASYESWSAPIPNSSEPGVVTQYTTFFPSPTTFVQGSSTYTLTEPTTLILTTSIAESSSFSSVSSSREPGAISEYTTVCTSPTTFTYGSSSYIITEATTLTLTTSIPYTSPTSHSESGLASGSAEPEVITEYTIYFPSPTTFIQGSSTYIVTEATTLTLTTSIPYEGVSGSAPSTSGVVTEYTTFFPFPTTFTQGSSEYTITKATTLTLTTSIAYTSESASLTVSQPELISQYTTFFPSPTTFSHGSSTYTITEATTLTLATSLPHAGPTRGSKSDEPQAVTQYTTFSPFPATTSEVSFIYTEDSALNLASNLGPSTIESIIPPWPLESGAVTQYTTFFSTPTTFVEGSSTYTITGATTLTLTTSVLHSPTYDGRASSGLSLSQPEVVTQFTTFFQSPADNSESSVATISESNIMSSGPQTLYTTIFESPSTYTGASLTYPISEVTAPSWAISIPYTGSSSELSSSTEPEIGQPTGLSPTLSNSIESTVLPSPPSVSSNLMLSSLSFLSELSDSSLGGTTLVSSSTTLSTPEIISYPTPSTLRSISFYNSTASSEFTIGAGSSEGISAPSSLSFPGTKSTISIWNNSSALTASKSFAAESTTNAPFSTAVNASVIFETSATSSILLSASITTEATRSGLGNSSTIRLPFSTEKSITGREISNGNTSLPVMSTALHDSTPVSTTPSGSTFLANSTHKVYPTTSSSGSNRERSLAVSNDYTETSIRSKSYFGSIPLNSSRVFIPSSPDFATSSIASVPESSGASSFYYTSNDTFRLSSGGSIHSITLPVRISRHSSQAILSSTSPKYPSSPSHEASWRTTAASNNNQSRSRKGESYIRYSTSLNNSSSSPSFTSPVDTNKPGINSSSDNCNCTVSETVATINLTDPVNNGSELGGAGHATYHEHIYSTVATVLVKRKEPNSNVGSFAKPKSILGGAICFLALLF